MNIKKKVISIVTKNDNIVPNTAIASYDVSEEQNKSVMAYLEDDGTGAGTYKLTIGSKGKVIASESMKNYFNGFTNLKSMDLSNLDTSFTTNMADMFNNCSNLTELDISNFNTENLTNIGTSLFDGCDNLTNLNMSNFNFTKVPSGKIISKVNENLAVNLSNANFSGRNNNREIMIMIPVIDLSGADFSNSNMNGLFANGCLNSINLSNVNITGVTDMSYMFYNCIYLKTLDLSKFNSKISPS